ncbi:MAG: MotA/TolQ/ExbB proton channel family protein [Planctomycetales bacterium]|nr:MotA/TolQ/ExbB proton channel family protein [Planctomycetales bacterium]
MARLTRTSQVNATYKISAATWGRQRIAWLALVLGMTLSGSVYAEDVADSPSEVGGFFSIVFSGGWVGATIVMVLLILSLVAMYLVVEQIMVLRKKEVMPSGLADSIRQLLAQGRLTDADAACRQKPSPLAFVLLSGLSEIEYGWSAMEKAMEDAIAEQAAKMYRKIEYLSVIGNLAPMCGLLGTVTGMIFAFQQVAISHGNAGVSDLAEGIYSALVTTVAGLVVAIPSLGAFAVFRNRIDQLIAETAYMAQHVFAPVRRRASKVGGRPAVVSNSGTAPPQVPPRAQS